MLEPEGTTARWQQHPLMPAMPVIDRCLESAAIDADNLIVVSDAEGMLLSVRGSAALRSRAFDDMNFVEGALWSESGAGTNAIGTAVAAGHAVQVFAAEHFTESVHRWTCAAAPMYDPDTGGLLGVIDVTGDISGVQPHSLAVVVATAQAVELFLRERLHERDDRLRERYAHQLTPSGAALVTGTGRLVFGRAPQWSAEDLPRCIPAGGGRLLLPSGRPAVAEPLPDEDVYVMRLDTPRARQTRPGARAHAARRQRRGAAGRRADRAAPPPPRAAGPALDAPRQRERRRPLRRALRRGRPPRQHPRRALAPAQARGRRHRRPPVPACVQRQLRLRARARRCWPATTSWARRPPTPARCCRALTRRGSSANASPCTAGCARRC